jgi:predicted transcriptional regulator of viral defense system
MQQLKTYSDTAGLRLLSRLPETGIFRTHDALKAGAGLELSASHVHKLLHELAASAWIARLQRGLYAPVDRQTAAPRAHPFTIGTALVRPAAVSHWSALAHWELTDQVPQVVTVSSPTLTADRSRRRRSRSTETDDLWTVAGHRYRVVFIRQRQFFGLKDVWVDERERVPIYDAERALLDTLQHFHVFGSLTPALEILEEHVGDLDLDRLVDYATRLAVGPVTRRLGWALEHVGAPQEVRARLATHLLASARAVRLDPTRPGRGEHSKVWGVVENLGAQ